MSRLASTAAVLAWREAAIADGWEHEPLYPGCEDEASACRLRRNDWVAHVIARDLPTDDVIAWWVPDGLAVKAPYPYSFNALVAGTRTCIACGSKDVDTHRYGFAGRCCATCLPEMRRLHEFEGWTR